MSIHLDIDPDDHALFLAALGEKHAAKVLRKESLAAELATASQEVADLAAKIARYSTSAPKIQGDVPSVTADAPPPLLSPGGRIKKGHTEKLILAHLAERNGEGSTIPDLARSTNTKYSTVRRILKASKSVKPDGEKWHFVHPQVETVPPSFDVAMDFHHQTGQPLTKEDLS